MRGALTWPKTSIKSPAPECDPAGNDDHGRLIVLPMHPFERPRNFDLYQDSGGADRLDDFLERVGDYFG